MLKIFIQKSIYWSFIFFVLFFGLSVFLFSHYISKVKAECSPTAIEICDGIDNDCNGNIDEHCVNNVDNDQDGYDYTNDCNDNEASIHPNAIEICDGKDNDCNRDIDEGCARPDSDHDGYHFYIDCDDTDPLIYPGAPEICDHKDNNCDGSFDENCIGGIDLDKDGYYSEQDCNDNDLQINPGAIESCDGKDNNCDGRVDENCVSGRSIDRDQDGYNIRYDCDDTDESIHPDAVEICDHKDNNCNGTIDEGCPQCTDHDNDGYCLESGDCNDNNANINPHAVEIAGDNVDSNCDGEDNPDVVRRNSSSSSGATYCSDADADGYCGDNNSDCNDNNKDIHPGALEVCGDNIDNNCSGQIDENCANSSAINTIIINTEMSDENKATIAFIQIYTYEPIEPIDWNFISYVVNGTKPETRNLYFEDYATKKFAQVFKHLPESDFDWNIVRAIAYSGKEKIEMPKVILPSKPLENKPIIEVKKETTNNAVFKLLTNNKPIVNIEEGDLIRTTDNTMIYLIENGYRHPILSESIFNSWGYDINNLKTVFPEDLNKYLIGYPVLFKDGTLFKGMSKGINNDSAGTIYLVWQGQYLPFASQELYKTIFNVQNLDKVIQLDDDVLVQIIYPFGYAVGPKIASIDSVPVSLLGEAAAVTSGLFGIKGQTGKYLLGLALLLVLVSVGLSIFPIKKKVV